MWEEEAAAPLEPALLAGGSLEVAHPGQAGQQNWSSSYEASGAVSTSRHHSALWVTMAMVAVIGAITVRAGRMHPCLEYAWPVEPVDWTLVSHRASGGFNESSYLFLKPPISYPAHQLSNLSCTLGSVAAGNRECSQRLR